MERLLGLGNELLADDAVGILAAREVRRVLGGVEAIECPQTGFSLLDYVQGVSRLIVIDSIITGSAPPGTIHIFEEDSVAAPHGQSPHAVGLFEVLAVARGLGLAVPDHVLILAVEAADCSTVGGAMHPDVRAAIPRIAQYVRRS